VTSTLNIQAGQTTTTMKEEYHLGTGFMIPS